MTALFIHPRMTLFSWLICSLKNTFVPTYFSAVLLHRCLFSIYTSTASSCPLKEENYTCSSNDRLGGWTFISALSQLSHTHYLVVYAKTLQHMKSGWWVCNFWLLFGAECRPFLFSRLCRYLQDDCQWFRDQYPLIARVKGKSITSHFRWMALSDSNCRLATDWSRTATAIHKKVVSS